MWKLWKSTPHCKNKKSGKPSSSAYTEEKFRMENPDFRVDIQSSFVRWRHQSHILHKKIKSPLPFTPIHLSFRIYVYLCLFYNLINHNLVRYSNLKVYSIFDCIIKEPWWHSILRHFLQYIKIQYVLQNICQFTWKCLNW